MNEFALLLQLMKEPRPYWERFPEANTTAIRVVETKPAASDATLDSALTARLREIAERSTGRLVRNEATRLWVPEEK